MGRLAKYWHLCSSWRRCLIATNRFLPTFARKFPYMKQIVLLISCLMVAFVARTQNFDVKFLPGTQDAEPQLMKFEDGYYAVDYEPKGIVRTWSPKLSRVTHNITLTKYDTDMKAVKTFRLPGSEKSYGPLPPAFKVINNTLYLFFTKLTEDNKITMYMGAIDPTMLEMSAPTELMVIDESTEDIYSYLRFVDFQRPDFHNRAFFGRAAFRFSKTFIVRQSPDGAYLTVAWASSQNDKLYLALLDKNMKRIQSKTHLLPAKSWLSITSACIDNNGSTYFTYGYRKKGGDIMNEIYISRKDGSEENKTIDLPSGSIAEIRTVADNKKDLVWFCGSYTENTDNLAGVYHVALDTKTSVWGSITKTPFDKALVEILDKEGWAKTKEKKYGLKPDLVWEANIFNDGILHLTGEFREIVEGQRANFGLAGSILNTSFRDGKAIFSRIPKARVSAGSTYGDSYRIFSHQNQLIVFYNDYPSNLLLDLSAEPKRSDVYTQCALIAAIIRADGSVTREVAIDKSDENLLSSLYNISELEPGRYFVPLRRIKNLGGITNDVQWTVVKRK